MPRSTKTDMADPQLLNEFVSRARRIAYAGYSEVEATDKIVMRMAWELVREIASLKTYEEVASEFFGNNDTEDDNS